MDGNPPFPYWIGSWFRKYGEGRVRWSYPGRSYVEAGIVAGAGSDVPVTPISPWWGLWPGVVRKELGVLAPGAFADLIVVDRDVLSVPADELKDVKVLQSVVAGEVVFTRP